jgi:hypothetical protein
MDGQKAKIQLLAGNINIMQRLIEQKFFSPLVAPLSIRSIISALSLCNKKAVGKSFFIFFIAKPPRSDE